MGQDAHPKNRVHISITNGWKSLKMIYNQELVKFSVCRIFFGKIHDIVEMKRHYYFWPKMGVLPHMWPKRPPRGTKRPPMGISPRHYDDENVESLFITNRILLKLQLDVNQIIVWTTRLSVVLCNYWPVVRNLLHVLYPIIENVLHR